MTRGLKRLRLDASRSIRGIALGRLRVGCVVCQVIVLAVSAPLFLAAPLGAIREHDRREASEAAARDQWLLLRERMRVATSDLRLLGYSVETPEHETGDAAMNRLLDYVNATAGEVGAVVRVFDRAGQGSGGDGFARVSLDTNFLQMVSIIQGIKALTLPVRVDEFQVASAGKNSDIVSLSLAFSVVESFQLKTQGRSK